MNNEFKKVGDKKGGNEILPGDKNKTPKVVSEDPSFRDFDADGMHELAIFGRSPLQDWNPYAAKTYD
jgi:hypothetical protein